MTRSVVAKPMMRLDERFLSKPEVEIDGKIYKLRIPYLPHEEQAERELLGYILQAGESGTGLAAFKLTQRLQLHNTEFYIQRHAIVFRAMEDCHRAGMEIDLTTIEFQLVQAAKGSNSLLNKIGGRAFLIQLADNAGFNIESYLEIVKNASLDRYLVAAGDLISQLSAEKGLTPSQKAGLAEDALREVTVRIHSITDQNTYDLNESLIEYGERLAKEWSDPDFRPGLETGWTYLTKRLLGWQDGRLYVIAAPSGWGKTIMLVNAAINQLRQGKRVLFISTEMSLAELLERFVCAWAEINYSRWQARKPLDFEKARFNTALAEIDALYASGAMILYMPKQAPTISQIRAKLDEYRFKLDIVIIDYIHPTKIEMPPEGRHWDELKRNTYIWDALEEMKKVYWKPFVVGSQLNRGWADRVKWRPSMADLYGGSKIENVADAIMFIFRHDLGMKEPEYPDKATISFGKNRSGPSTKPFDLRYWGHFVKMVDYRKNKEDEEKSAAGQDAEALTESEDGEVVTRTSGQAFSEHWSDSL